MHATCSGELPSESHAQATVSSRSISFVSTWRAAVGYGVLKARMTEACVGPWPGGPSTRLVAARRCSGVSGTTATRQASRRARLPQVILHACRHARTKGEQQLDRRYMPRSCRHHERSLTRIARRVD